MTSARPGRRWAVPLVALALLSGCTTVPTTSDVSVVATPGIVPQQQVLPPPPGADPADIVRRFLSANATSDDKHTQARAYLTNAEKRRWSDNTITVVDNTQVGSAVRGKVSVQARLIGTIDQSGVYTPVLRGDGSGGGSATLQYTVKQVDGQNRIDAMSTNSVVLTLDQFSQLQQRKVYYFDVAEKHLVPVARYTQLTDQRDLGNWLVSELTDGPPTSTGLQTALPELSNPKLVQLDFPVDIGNPDTPVKVEIPGAGQLEGTNRNLLAAQIGATLQQVSSISTAEITDGGVPVRIPAARSTRFEITTIAAGYQLAPPSPNELYYVRSGGVYDAEGQRLPGKVGLGSYNLTSVALYRPAGSGPFAVAGVRGSGDDEYLDIGTTDQLAPTRVHGRLSRPSWAPGADEVWVGVGSSLLRVTPGGVPSVVPLDVVGGKASGTVSAVRVSPDGGRVALILTASDGSAQAYVGNIVRGPNNQARVGNLVPITPQDVDVTDLSWNDELKLFTVGTDQETDLFGVYEVQCDGSLWHPLGTLGLPGTPDSVAVAANSVAAVSVGDTVWQQVEGSTQIGSWEGPDGDETHGGSPVYIE